MDACEDCSSSFVSALDDEPDAEDPPSSDTLEMEPEAEEFPPSSDTLEMAPDDTLEETLVHLHNLDLFNQGSVAEPDVSPTYQNPFGEIEDEAQAHSPTKAQTKAKPKTNCQAQTMAMPKTKGKAKNKAKTKPT